MQEGIPRGLALPAPTLHDADGMGDPGQKPGHFVAPLEKARSLLLVQQVLSPASESRLSPASESRF
jgi:hypothetical protein